MKIFKLVFWGLCIGLVSCSKAELNIEEETPDTKKDVWTLKVEVGEKGDAVTKALSMNPDGTIKSEWVLGDSVEVHKYLDNGQLSLVAKIGSLSAETSGLHTTFSGSLTSVEGLSVGSKLRLSYPGYNSDYRGQDGTLQYISDHCNFSYAEVEITELDTDTKVITTTNAVFRNCQAIWKLKFRDAGGDINVTSVTIAADHIRSYETGSLAFGGQITITPTTPANEIWVAVYSMNRDNNYVIKCVTDDSRKLSCVKKGNLQSGNYYTSTLTMEPLDANFITEINTVSDLVQLSNEVGIGKTYEGQTVTLNSNLDLSEIDNFQPIGLTASLPFKGVFNGNHKTISNLKITTESSSANYTGLFGYMAGASSSVYDLTLADCNISSNNNNKTGGMAGYSEGSFTNCTVLSGSVTGKKDAAGIVSHISMYGSRSPVSNCHFSGTVTATAGTAAGIINSTTVDVLNCTNTGAITATSYAGGIVSSGNKVVKDCNNTGNVTGGYAAGGIIGYVTGGGEISNCSNSGNVRATNKANWDKSGGVGSYAGGIVGRFYENTGTIDYCINEGQVSGDYDYVGGIVGYIYVNKMTLSNCENRGNVISLADCVGGVVGAAGVKDINTIVLVKDCLNSGTVTGRDKTGGIEGCLIGTTSNYIESHPENTKSSISLEGNLNVGAVSATSGRGCIAGVILNPDYSIFNFDSNYYLSTSGIVGGLNGADQEGAKGAYKIVAGSGVTLTPSTAEDLLHSGVKYFVSGKEVTVTLSGGSSYSAVDAASNPVTLTDNGGGSYTLTIPAADVTISAN